jgi:predicted Zn-dependent protease
MRCSLLWLPCLGVALTLMTVATAFAESPPTCAGKAPPETPLAADTVCTTEAGVTLTVPTGWSVSARARALLVEPPEGDSHLVLMSVDAADAATAVAAAWRSFRPTESRPLRMAELPSHGEPAAAHRVAAGGTERLGRTARL